MLVLEYKVKGKEYQYSAIDDAIRTTQFIRNKAIRYWMDAPKEMKIDKFALNKYSTELRKQFSFAAGLNSMAVQSAAERGWFAISRFYDNCKSKKSGKTGYPRFQKNCRSVEYKTSGWKLHTSKRRITFTDKKGIGELKLLGKWDIHTYNIKDISGCELHRDTNAAINILNLAKARGGHPQSNANGLTTSTLLGEPARSWGFPP